MGLRVSIVLILKFSVEMRDKLEATRSEIFDVVPVRGSSQLGTLERREFRIKLGSVSPPEGSPSYQEPAPRLREVNPSFQC